MSGLFPEDLEYDEAFDDAEAYDDSEGYDDAEASRAAQARSRRALAMRRARLRASSRRVTSLPSATPPRAAVVSAVKELDLQSQVQQDTLRSVVASQGRKLDRANLATVSTLLIGEAFRTFGTPSNEFVRVGLQASPLLLLSPGRSRRGIEGIVRHPAFYGGVGALGLAFIGNQRKRDTEVRTVRVLGPTQLEMGVTDSFVAEVLDGDGKPSTVVPTWASLNEAAATIDKVTGIVTPHSRGGTVITATAGTVVGQAHLQVVAEATE